MCPEPFADVFCSGIIIDWLTCFFLDEYFTYSSPELLCYYFFLSNSIISSGLFFRYLPSTRVCLTRLRLPRTFRIVRVLPVTRMTFSVRCLPSGSRYDTKRPFNSCFGIIHYLSTPELICFCQLKDNMMKQMLCLKKFRLFETPQQT